MGNIHFLVAPSSKLERADEEANLEMPLPA